MSQAEIVIKYPIVGDPPSDEDMLIVFKRALYAAKCGAHQHLKGRKNSRRARVFGKLSNKELARREVK